MNEYVCFRGYFYVWNRSQFNIIWLNLKHNLKLMGPIIYCVLIINYKKILLTCFFIEFTIQFTLDWKEPLARICSQLWTVNAEKSPNSNGSFSVTIMWSEYTKGWRKCRQVITNRTSLETCIARKANWISIAVEKMENVFILDFEYQKSLVCAEY